MAFKTTVFKFGSSLILSIDMNKSCRLRESLPGLRIYSLLVIRFFVLDSSHSLHGQTLTACQLSFAGSCVWYNVVVLCSYAVGVMWGCYM